MLFPKYAVAEAKFFECQHLSLLNLSIGEFADLLRQSGYRKFIILNRRNYLKTVVSTQIGLARGNQWHLKVGEEMPRISVRLDIDHVSIQGKTCPMINLFEYMDKQYEILRRSLAEEDVLALTYEDDISGDPRVAYTKVCRWLGLEAVPVGIPLKKINTDELNEVVENWSEVVAALAGTRYAWMTGSAPHS
jgi:hypothetical protein